MDWELKFFAVLVVANIIIDYVCRAAAPKPWARVLCLATFIPNGLANLMTLKVCVDLHRGKVDGLAGIFILPGLVIFVESLWMAYLYYSRFYRAKRSPLPPS
jgi:hypothetical protein